MSHSTVDPSTTQPIQERINVKRDLSVYTICIPPFWNLSTTSANYEILQGHT